MLKNARNNSRSPLSRRRKSVTEGSKIKQGGILGQDKTKRREDGLTTKTKSRFGRDVKVDRMGGAKVKTVTDKDGNQLKKKVKSKLLGRSTKSYKGGGKVVAQGADKKDVRRERKQDRVAARAVKKANRGENTTTKTIGNRTVTKQKNRSDDGVKSTRKTVYSGNQASRLVTKEKQRTNRKGKKAGMLNMKDKIVDRKDFSVRRKTKGIDPRGGS